MRRHDTARVLGFVGAVSVLVQFASVTWLAPSLDTPNASTILAQQLVATGDYGVLAWPRTMPAGSPEPLLRAYLLPAEPLYLAAAFRWLPPAVWPYLHLPITSAFVLAVAAVGLAVGGARLGLWAGLLAAFDPFVVRHGPVWDDVFLASALEWMALACLCWSVSDRRCCAALSRPGALAALVMLGAVAALTRAPSQVFVAVPALLVVVHPRFRQARQLGVALLIGVTAGVLGWGVRNQAVLGEFFIGTSHDGITLLESTSPAARPSILATGTAEGFASAALAAEYQAARAMEELEADRHFRRAAWQNMSAAPVDTFVTAVVKIAVSVSGVHLGEPLLGARNVVAVGFNAVLWTMAGVGVARLRRRGGNAPAALVAIAGVAFVLVTLVLLSLGPVGIRYRVTLTGMVYLAGVASVLASRPSSRNDIATV